MRVGDERRGARADCTASFRTRCDGLDLAQPEYTVQLDAVSVPAENLLAGRNWSKLQSDAFVLRAAAILGSAETCLALAQEHVSTRRQFGHALSYNQAIRHTLARHKLALEGIRHRLHARLFADSGCASGVRRFSPHPRMASRSAKARVQMHGGMGFTWDVPVHRHLRRIRALQAQGDASGVLAALGHDYIAEVKPAREHAAA